MPRINQICSSKGHHPLGESRLPRLFFFLSHHLLSPFPSPSSTLPFCDFLKACRPGEEAAAQGLTLLYSTILWSLKAYRLPGRRRLTLALHAKIPFCLHLARTPNVVHKQIWLRNERRRHRIGPAKSRSVESHFARLAHHSPRSMFP